MSDYAKLRELAESATPGPWNTASDWYRYAVYADNGKRVVCSGNQNNAGVWHTHDWSGADKEDALYIAAANPQTILALLDDLAALRARHEKLREGLQNITRCRDFILKGPGGGHYVHLEKCADGPLVLHDSIRKLLEDE